MTFLNDRILIIGATGFIGMHFMELLSGENCFHKTRIMTRSGSDQARIDRLQGLIPSLEIVQGDLRDIQSLRNALRDCDVVVNLGGKVDYRKSHELVDVNIKGVETLCMAALEQNVKLVHTSSTAALGYSANVHDLKDENSVFDFSGKGYHYAESKLEGDRICLNYYKKHELQVVICLPSEVYGEGGYGTAKNLVDLINFPVAWNGGTSVVYVKDVARGILNAIKYGRIGEKYILGSENLTISQITEKILELYGQNSRVYKIPNFILNHPVRYISLLQQKLNLEPLFDPDVIRYATRYWFVRNDKARQELDFRPENSDMLLGLTINWLADQKLI